MVVQWVLGESDYWHEQIERKQRPQRTGYVVVHLFRVKGRCSMQISHLLSE